MELTTLTTLDGMDSRDIAALTGKDHNHVCRDIRAMFAGMEKEENPDLAPPPNEEEYHRGDRMQYKYLKESTIKSFIDFGGRKNPGRVCEESCRSTYVTAQNKQATCYLLPKRECIILASGYNVKLRAAIVDRWEELERSKPQMTRLEFARALLEAEERAEQVEREKGLLLVELDKSKEYASIKRVEKMTGKKFSWRKLKAQAHEMGVESKEVFDQNYGTVKAYRADVWMETYGITLIPE